MGCLRLKKNKISKISINAIIQLNLNILKENKFFPNINDSEFENMIISSIICKIISIILKITYPNNFFI